jgi:cellulose synthase/poly-beta-1,6-N-acetylglucosamine synthase-like glycosyltransferase
MRFLVVIPAHNEARVIGGTIDSVLAEARVQDIVLVVADRCEDDTAAVARAKGIWVVERRTEEAEGRAAAVATGIETGMEREWDAVVTIDADSLVEPGFFAALEERYATGCQAVQARSESIRGDSVLARVSEAAYAMQGVVIPRGRDVLGLSVRMRGSGMSVRRRVAEEQKFSQQGASEDLWFSLELLLRGILPRHADRARLRSLSAPDLGAAGRQRMRWDAGRLLLARHFAWKLLRRANPASFEAAIHLLTPPFAVAGFLLASGFILALIAGATALAWVVGALVLVLALALVVALVESEAGAKTWVAMAVAPLYVVWKTALWLRALLNVRDARRPYKPTPRT